MNASDPPSWSSLEEMMHWYLIGWPLSEEEWSQGSIISLADLDTPVPLTCPLQDKVSEFLGFLFLWLAACFYPSLAQSSLWPPQGYGKRCLSFSVQEVLAPRAASSAPFAGLAKIKNVSQNNSKCGIKCFIGHKTFPRQLTRWKQHRSRDQNENLVSKTGHWSPEIVEQNINHIEAKTRAVFWRKTTTPNPVHSSLHSCLLILPSWELSYVKMGLKHGSAFCGTTVPCSLVAFSVSVSISSLHPNPRRLYECLWEMKRQRTLNSRTE